MLKALKYLEHIIADNNMDDADIQREMTNMFIHTNTLSRKFGNCTTAVKKVLFRS